MPAYQGLESSLNSLFRKDREKYRLANGSEVILPSKNDLKFQKTLEDYDTGVGKFLGQAMYSIGQQVPSMVAGGLAGGIGKATGLLNTAKGVNTARTVGSLATMFDEVSTATNNQKLSEGYTEEQARQYSLMSGAIEIGTEMLFGGLGKLMGVGALDNVVTEKLTRNINNRVIKSLADAGISSVGEGIEEILSDVLQPFAKKIALDDKRSYGEIFKDENALEDFLVGTLSSVIMSAPSTVVSFNNNDTQSQNNIRINKDLISNQTQTNLENIKYSQSNNQKSNHFTYEKTGNTKLDNYLQSASENFDNTIESQNFINPIGKIAVDKGYNILFDSTITNEQGVSVNGKITTLDNGEVEIRLNPNSSKSGEFLIIHEVTHAIETEEMKNLVMDFASHHDDFKNALESLKQTYKTDDVTSEVLADISGQLFGNQEFINNLSVNKPNVFKRIYNAIISLANKITGNNNMSLFVKDLKAKWENAYRNTTTEQTVNNLNNESIYSIMQNTQGKYVKADRQVITGNNPLKWEQQVENYINDTIRNGKDVEVFTDSGDVLTITADTAGKAKFRNFYLDNKGQKHYMTNNEFLTKLSAETHIDELAQTSKQKNKNTVPDYKNHQFAKDGFNYRTAFFEDHNGDYYKVTMSVGKNGNINTIYNVGKLEQRKRPVISGSSVNNNGANGPLTSNTLPQNNDKVKLPTKYSMQENQNNATDNKGRTLSKEQQEFLRIVRL